MCFDMAGTTVDEKNVVYQTVRRAINDSGYHFSQEQVQAAGAGKEKSQAIRDVLALDGAEHSDQEISTIFAHFKIMLAKAYEELDVQPQPGTFYGGWITSWTVGPFKGDPNHPELI